MLKLLGVATAITLAACVPSDPTSGIGVTTSDGDIHVQLILCPDEQLEALQLETAGDFEPEGSEVLWRIESTGPTVTNVTVGVVPPGFTEVHAMEVEVGDMELLGVTADLTDMTVETSVHIADLEEGQYLLDGHSFDPAEFAALDCNY